MPYWLDFKTFGLVVLGLILFFGFKLNRDSKGSPSKNNKNNTPPQ